MLFMNTDPQATPDTDLAGDSNNHEPEAVIARLQDEIAALKDQALRALAEADNTRKRADKEKQDIGKFAIAGFARDLLTVMDTFDRALASMPPVDNNSPWKAFAEGVSMTAAELQKAFEKNGLRKVDPIGEKFDHNHHQAMMEMDAPGKEPGTVAQVLQSGYVLHDRLVRPALVGVVRGAGTDTKA
jgi:molecular chaperone GrpE